MVSDSRRLLVFVLNYDDPLADASVAVVLGEQLTFARGEGAARLEHAGDTVRLKDPWVSGQHARIERRGTDDVLVDLESSNGTRVQNELVKERVLRDGDLLEVGHSLFTYRVVDAHTADALIEEPRGQTFGPTRTLSPELLKLRADVLKMAHSDVPVLVLGEPGTGKEAIAALLHVESGRAGALRSVDCSTIPESLFESTFFGHKAGLFSSAGAAKLGEFALADGGTLFLEGVGQLALEAQGKLLSVLTSQLVTQQGAAEAQRIDARIVAASDRDLCDGGEFRPPLLERLSGFVVRLPALRARREDLGNLCAYFLREAGAEQASISSNAARRLFFEAFPGNLEQLRSTLQSAVLLAGDGPIEVEHIQQWKAKNIGENTEKHSLPPATDFSRPVLGEAALRGALERAEGDLKLAARELGILPGALSRMIARFGIEPKQYRR
jgi:DNA-binding NtrC family response regulator